MIKDRSGCMPQAYTTIMVTVQVADLSHENFKSSHEIVTLRSSCKFGEIITNSLEDIALTNIKYKIAHGQMDSLTTKRLRWHKNDGNILSNMCTLASGESRIASMKICGRNLASRIRICLLYTSDAADE